MPLPQQVEPIKREYQYASPGQAFQWVLSRVTYIRPVTDADQKIPCPAIHSSPFGHLRTYVNTGFPIDIIVVVISVNEPRYREVRKKMTPLRKCVVMQKELKPVTLTLWGDFVHHQGADLSELRNKMPIVLCKGLIATPYSGLSLSTMPFSFVVLDPEIAEVKALREWVNGNSNAIKTAASTPVKDYLESFADSIDTVALTPLAKIEADTKAAHSEVTLSIADVDQRVCHAACPKCSQTRKAIPNEVFYCNSCRQELTATGRSCRVVVELNDPSGSIKETLFDKCAT